jgi:hypothetical protein
MNMFQNQLGGTLPSAIGVLTNLISLQLSGNSIGGTVPTEIGKLRNMVSGIQALCPPHSPCSALSTVYALGTRRIYANSPSAYSIQ